jgi:hypothetical protein
MSQHCHREENEATDSSVGTSGPPFRAIDQQHFGISHAGDHVVVEDPQNPGGKKRKTEPIIQVSYVRHLYSTCA